MAQFTWHDGTTRNLHVDFVALFSYQKQLANVVKLFEQRIDWLATGSRKIFGAINEEKCVGSVVFSLNRIASKIIIF